MWDSDTPITFGSIPFIGILSGGCGCKQIFTLEKSLFKKMHII